MLAGDISLDILRAKVSSTKCIVPFCDVEYPFINRIPKETRYEIMKSKRFFIPARSLACAEHAEFSVWSQIVIPNGKSMFKAAQIEEMVNLLLYDPKSSGDNLRESIYMRTEDFEESKAHDVHFHSTASMQILHIENVFIVQTLFCVLLIHALLLKM